MNYKKKLTVLSGIIAALALVYLLTIIFDPDRRGARSSIYSWLDPAQTGRISGISIANDGEVITLVRNGGMWFVSHEGKDYPARSIRIADFIAALAKRAPYPVRSVSAAAHEKLSLTEDSAVRVTVAAGAGQPLLSLLVGQPDSAGHMYLRRQGQNEVRSGEDIFSSYTGASLSSWYNLRLFPENEDGSLDSAGIQRLTVYAPGDDGESAPPLIFTRSGRGWTFNFELANPNVSRVDAYIRDILTTSGDDFAASVSPSDPLFNYSRIVLEWGDGSARTIRAGPPDENGRRFVSVSGSDLVYTLPGWTSQRLFITPDQFESTTSP